MSGADERPPVLKVRKDAQRELTFHYNREERTSLRRPARRQSGRPRLFARLRRGGRGLLLLLLILIGALAVILLTRALSREQPTGRLAGYDISLRAYAYPDAVLASVAVVWNPAARDQASEAAVVTVKFSAPPGSAATVASESLTGGQAVVRGRLAGTGAERRVVAEVAVGAKELRLTAAIGEP